MAFDLSASLSFVLGLATLVLYSMFEVNGLDIFEYGKYVAVCYDRVASYEEASKYCNKPFGGTLATLTNDEDVKTAMEAASAVAVHRYGIDEQPGNLWIGLNDIGSPYNYQFEDGTAYDGSFNKFENGYPDNEDDTRCVAMDGETGTWYDLPCDGQDSDTDCFLCNINDADNSDNSDNSDNTNDEQTS